MSRSEIILLLFSIILIIILILILLKQICQFNYIKEDWKEEKRENPLIVCIMITGKDKERLNFARKSIKNFTEQSYPHKKLLILNHHEQSIEQPMDIEQNVFHFQIKKQNMSLGALRNIALELVPLNAFWTVWDDDDVRSHDYLSTLYHELESNKADCLAFTNRYEYNVGTKLAWKMTLKSGFPLLLCQKNPNIQYQDKNTMEDVQLINDVIKQNMKVTLFDNNPAIYVRLVHQTNTSLYVNKGKNKVHQSKNRNYKEYDVSKKEKDYIVKQISLLLN